MRKCILTISLTKNRCRVVAVEKQYYISVCVCVCVRALVRAVVFNLEFAYPRVHAKTC